MIINLQSNKDGEWFPFFYSHIDPSTMEITYDDPIEGGPKMKIRNPVSFFREKSKERKSKSEFVFNKKSRGMEKVVSEVELTPAQKAAENEDLFDFVIQGIEGFKLDGREIKCTRAEKVTIMELPVVSMFVNRCVELLQEQAAVEEDGEVKNSPTGSSSAKTKRDPG